jgi:membrane protease YdiL (CAAX protease family)
VIGGGSPAAGLLQLRSARRTAAVRAALLGVGVLTAATLRWTLGGADPAASFPAALVFSAALAGCAAGAGFRPSRPRTIHLLLGLAGGAALLAVWGGAHPLVLLNVTRLERPGLGALVPWTAVVVVVVTCEEAVLRGVLFSGVAAAAGPWAALVATSILFALIHLPLYGTAALPVDLAVGVVLGGLRLATGGLAAPLAAHLAADLALGWLT